MGRNRDAVTAALSLLERALLRRVEERLEQTFADGWPSLTGLPKPGAERRWLLRTLREHPHVGWLLIRSEQQGALVLGPRGTRFLATGEVEGEDPLAEFSPNAASHLARSDGFTHAADIFVGSFYDPTLEEGCAFEELISFHGGLGGPQTRPFLLYPVALEAPAEPILGAASVNEILRGWRSDLQGEPQEAPVAEPAEAHA